MTALYQPVLPFKKNQRCLLLTTAFPAILGNAEEKLMGNFVWLGRLGGFVGILMFAVAVIVRLSGRFVVGAFQVGTLLQVAIAGMILGCFCFLLVLTERTKPN
jgi:hypothetical protein